MQAPWNHQKSQCQICGKTDHLAIEYWHRFNQDYQGLAQAHSTHYSPQGSYDQSMVATLSTVLDPLWYPDSRASQHITHDDGNLFMKSAYSRQDRVNIGNGTDLRIQHIGHSYFTFPSCCKPVILHNLLHVPSITKNLLSVFKFARDNRVFFEFYPNHCNVKHQDTNETLLRGQIKDGLYVFPQFQPFKHAFTYS